MLPPIGMDVQLFFFVIDATPQRKGYTVCDTTISTSTDNHSKITINNGYRDGNWDRHRQGRKTITT